MVPLLWLSAECKLATLTGKAPSFTFNLLALLTFLSWLAAEFWFWPLRLDWSNEVISPLSSNNHQADWDLFSSQDPTVYSWANLMNNQSTQTAYWNLNRCLVSDLLHLSLCWRMFLSIQTELSPFCLFIDFIYTKRNKCDSWEESDLKRTDTDYCI